MNQPTPPTLEQTLRDSGMEIDAGTFAHRSNQAHFLFTDKHLDSQPKQKAKKIFQKQLSTIGFGKHPSTYSSLHQLFSAGKHSLDYYESSFEEFPELPVFTINHTYTNPAQLVVDAKVLLRGYKNALAGVYVDAINTNTKYSVESLEADVFSNKESAFCFWATQLNAKYMSAQITNRQATNSSILIDIFSSQRRDTRKVSRLYEPLQKQELYDEYQSLLKHIDTVYSSSKTSAA